MSVMQKLRQATEKFLDPKKALAPLGEKSAAADAGDGLTDLVVWSVPAVNTRLLICHEPGVDGGNPMNLVNVTVRDNSRFLKKMALRARRGSDRKFNLEGPLPRWRGRW